MPLSEFPRVPGKHNDPKQLGYWKLGRILGEGTSGRVRIARHAKTGQMAAIKIIPKNLLTSRAEDLNLVGADTDRQEQSLRREVVLMKLIEHPNIMGLYDVWDLPNELFLVLEYVQGGELLEYLSNSLESGNKTIPLSQALSFFQQIVIAVSYCHRLNVSHRDLKLENILVDNDNNIKIADFGLASFQPNSIVRTACGSLHYCAPEVVTGYGNYNGPMADVWSCGIILYALLTCSLPFCAELEDDLKDEILNANVHFPDSIPPDAQDLISKMLTKDVQNRITMSDVQNHPFFLLQKPMILYRGISSLEQIAMPLKSADDIDPELLRSLRTLWREASEDEVKDSLTSLNMNWQKGAYHLLFEYRRKRLEAYDEQVAEIEEKRMQKEARAQARTARHAVAKAAKKAEFASSPTSLPSRDGPPTPRRASRKDKDQHDSHPPPSSIPSREGPPTPRRAARGGRIPGPVSAASSDASFIPMSRPSHLVPSTFSDDEIKSCSSSSKSSHQTLKSTSLAPTGITSTAKTPLSVSLLPPIAIPESDDPKVQAFYNQVLEHLSVLHSRTTTTTTTATTASGGGGGARSVDTAAPSPSPGDHTAELLGVISPNLALMQEIFKDRTMMGSTPVPAPLPLASIESSRPLYPHSQHQPNELNEPTTRFQTRPLSLKRKETTTQKQKQQRPKRPTIVTANLDLTSSKPNPNPNVDSADKENDRDLNPDHRDLHLAVTPSGSGGVVKKSSMRKALGRGLGLGLGRMGNVNVNANAGTPTPKAGNSTLKRVQIIDPYPSQVPQSLKPKPSKLKKKRSLRSNYTRTPTSPAPSSTSSSSFFQNPPSSLSPFPVPSLLSPMSTGGSSGSSGWFANVFKFSKPEVFTLRSAHEVHTTRNECRRLLMAMDVRVKIEEDGPQGGGVGVLKCKLDEVNGRAIMAGLNLKATKFKVIIRQSQVEKGENSVGVFLILVHEKGSTDSFREVCKRLRREWTLDDVESRTPEQLVPSPLPPLATRRMELLSPV